jgi:murein DD-endopeptidase MepM/ murein hydrolase activator NlpD
MHPLEELPQIISDPYKPPPPNKPEERHHGVDFSYWHYGERDTMLGEPVQAVLGGIVASVLNDKYPYGNMILIETVRSAIPEPIVRLLEIPPGDSLYLLYAHLNKPPDFVLGDTIQACQSLGEVGESGNTDIPHLHLETRLGPAGKQFKSMLFYDTRATLEEMENYALWRTSGVFRHFDPMRLLFEGLNQ